MPSSFPLEARRLHCNLDFYTNSSRSLSTLFSFLVAVVPYASRLLSSKITRAQQLKCLLCSDILFEFCYIAFSHVSQVLGRRYCMSRAVLTWLFISINTDTLCFESKQPDKRRWLKSWCCKALPSTSNRRMDSLHFTWPPRKITMASCASCLPTALIRAWPPRFVFLFSLLFLYSPINIQLWSTTALVLSVHTRQSAPTLSNSLIFICFRFIYRTASLHWLWHCNKATTKSCPSCWRTTQGAKSVCPLCTSPPKRTTAKRPPYFSRFDPSLF